jgi:hypothetical protein
VTQRPLQAVHDDPGSQGRVVATSTVVFS